jgi:hypothetical protein
MRARPEQLPRKHHSKQTRTHLAQTAPPQIQKAKNSQAGKGSGGATAIQYPNIRMNTCKHTRTVETYKSDGQGIAANADKVRGGTGMQE